MTAICAGSTLSEEYFMRAFNYIKLYAAHQDSTQVSQTLGGSLNQLLEKSAKCTKNGCVRESLLTLL